VQLGNHRQEVLHMVCIELAHYDEGGEHQGTVPVVEP
jgi:hypothetical protein